VTPERAPRSHAGRIQRRSDPSAPRDFLQDLRASTALSEDAMCAQPTPGYDAAATPPAA